MSEHDIGKRGEQHKPASEQLTFDQRLNQVTPSELRAAMRAMGHELAAEEKKHHEVEKLQHQEGKSLDFSVSQAQSLNFSAAKGLDFSESKRSSSNSSSETTLTKVEQSVVSQPSQMAYDSKTGIYYTNDGFVISGAASPEVGAGLVLQDRLNKVAQVQQAEAHWPAVTPGQVNPLNSIDDSLVSLPATGINYRGVAGSIPVGDLYGPSRSECSEVSVDASASFLGLGGIGFNIYDQQNDECRLAQIVKQACATTELLSTDVANSRTVNEMMAKSDAVVAAAQYCSAVDDAAELEKKRLKSEDDE